MDTWSRSLIIRLADDFEKKIVREKENVNDFEKKIRRRLFRRISGWSRRELDAIALTRTSVTWVVGWYQSEIRSWLNQIKLYNLHGNIVTIQLTSLSNNDKRKITCNYEQQCDYWWFSGKPKIKGSRGEYM